MKPCGANRRASFCVFIIVPSPEWGQGGGALLVYLNGLAVGIYDDCNVDTLGGYFTGIGARLLIFCNSKKKC